MEKLLQIGKKLFTMCLSIIILLVVCAVPAVTAKEAPSSFTVKRTKVMESYIGDNNAFTAYATSDGVIVYCMDLAKKGATTGTKYTLSKEASVGLMYIVKNGYPNKKITNRDEIDQYITQSAVWWYLDETSGANNLSKAFQTTDKEAYAGIRDEIKKLVSDAKKATAAAKPSMSVSLENQNLKLTSDKKYYESDYVTVSLKGAQQYKLSFDNKNVSAIDEKGVDKTIFKAGEKFKVRILSSNVKEATNLKITVSATGKTEYASVFVPSDNNFQRVVSTEIYTKDVNLTKTLELNVTPSQKTCVIENGKYYGKDGKEVDKKTYNKECGKVCVIENGKYYGKDGKEVDKKTYNKECGKVCVIENGKYYGKDGKEVDKKTYNKECGKVCVIENEKYYGKDGKEVDKQTYNEECGKICVIENGKYYGKNGKEVDKQTYDKECSSTVIAVPNTLSNQSLVALVIGFMCVLSGAGLILYRYKFIKIN